VSSEAAWRIYFQATDPWLDCDRITLAATSLRESAQDAWEGKRHSSGRGRILQHGYKTLSLIPAICMAYVSLRLKEVRQWSGQSVGDLASYFESLETDVPPLGPEETRPGPCWMLYPLRLAERACVKTRRSPVESKHLPQDKERRISYITGQAYRDNLTRDRQYVQWNEQAK
jgi:hypothetical protein